MFEESKKYVWERLRSAAESGELPDKVALTTYEDDDTYKVFRPDEYEFGIAAKHERAMEELAAEISREFPTVWVYLVPLSLEEYESWVLEMNLEDSPATRAMYVSQSQEVRGQEIDELGKGKGNEN